jgi:hypothetical protein
MGLSELMARVVSGIETPEGEAFLALLAAGAGAGASGAAAVAAFRVITAVMLRAKPAIATTIFHRMFMKTSTIGVRL